MWQVGERVVLNPPKGTTGTSSSQPTSDGEQEPIRRLTNGPTLTTYLAVKGLTAKKCNPAPSKATLQALVKHDSLESPTAVYNEHVAAKLGELLDVSVASGALVKDGATGDMLYASLIAEGRGALLPHVTSSLAKHIADCYPWETSGLFVFDVFIGNWDRVGNVKASPRVTSRAFICGFDHANGLLMSASRDPAESIEALGRNDELLGTHLFGKHVSKALVGAWLMRFSALPFWMLQTRCVLGQSLNEVGAAEQYLLAEALKRRLASLPKLCSAVMASSKHASDV